MKKVALLGALALAFQPAVATAQSKGSDVFCDLYKLAVEKGPALFGEVRGKEVSSGTWRIKGVKLEGGRCVIRQGDRGELITCSMRNQSPDEAKRWARSMITDTRLCVQAITRFNEKSVSNSAKETQVERTSWTTRSSGSTLRISIINATKTDGASQSRMEVKYEGT